MQINPKANSISCTIAGPVAPVAANLVMSTPSSGVTMTMTDDLQIDAIEVANGSTLVLGVNTLEAIGDSGFYVYGDGQLDWDTGAKWLLSCVNPVEIDVTSGTEAPPIEVPIGGGGMICDGILCRSYTQADGDLTGSGVLETTSDFTTTGGTIANIAVTVGGTAEAHNTTITNADFSGGNALDATDNCTDGGGNTNVTF